MACPVIFREYSDVYLQSLAIMKEREAQGIVANEGLLFFKQKYEIR